MIIIEIVINYFGEFVWPIVRLGITTSSFLDICIDHHVIILYLLFQINVHFLTILLPLFHHIKQVVQIYIKKRRYGVITNVTPLQMRPDDTQLNQQLYICRSPYGLHH